MSGRLRGDILGEIFGRMQEHFEPCRAEGVDAVVVWNICARPDDDCDRFQMIIRDGECRLAEDVDDEPKIMLTLDPVSFLKLVSGSARGSALMLRGKLRPQGDIRLARRLEGMFHIP
jgi:putative sterol carrier protein